MPYKPARPCKVATCPNLTHDKSGYCEAHTDRRADYDKARGTAVERGYDARWKQTRDRYIRRHPLCADCQHPADMVHHKISKRQHGTDRDDNLMSLCNSCHAKRTKAEARGKR